MQPKKSYLMVFLLIFAINLAAFGQQDYKDKAVSTVGLIRASKDRGSTPKLIGLIRSQGVDFEVTPQIESELRNGGVKAPVVQAAKENYRFPGTNKRAAYVTVTSNIAATSFTIDGFASFVGNVTDRAMPPGTYRVTARRPGYSTETESIDVSSPGARRTLTFHLKPMSVDQLFAEAEAAFKLRDYRVVEENMREVLRKEPANARASVRLGYVYYVSGNFDQALEPLLRGIRGGEPAIFPVYRSKGGGWSARSVSPGRLVLRASSAAFQSGDKDDFDVAYIKIEGIKTSITDEVSMKVRIPKKKGKGEEDEKYNFLPAKNQLVQSSLAVCNCAGESKFILDVISDLRINANR